MTEKTLSDKIEESPTFGSGKYQYMIYADDVKEFIKELKETIKFSIEISDEPQELENILIEIDKKAGDKLLK